MPPSLLAELDAFDKKKMDPEVNEWVKERGAVPAHRDDWSKIAIWLLKHDMQECFVHFMNAWGLDKLDPSHGVRQLAATIVRCPDLRELSLWSMDIDDAAADSLAWALERVTTLTYFQMIECRISEQGLTTVAMSFKQNCSVNQLGFRELDNAVEDRPLSPGWVCTLAKALTVNKALEELSFDTVHLDAPSMAALNKMLEENKRISRLRVDTPIFPGWVGAAAKVCRVDDALVIAVQHTGREAIRALRSRITDVGMARIQSLAEYAVVADLFADQGPPTQ